MALLEKHRSVIYAHFVDTIGEEAAEAMLSQFPARDLDEPVTKEYVAAHAAELRADMAELRLEVARQTDRVITRMQVIAGLGFAVLAFLTVLSP